MLGSAPLRRPYHGENRTPPEVLCWDGRIDNREDLLRCLGRPLDRHCCSEALALAAYQQWGVAGLARVIGDWSIVIRDHTNAAIVLASDFMGIRPLYYHSDPSVVRWSTNLQSLVSAVNVDTLDDEYVAAYLLYGACPQRTPYAGIHSVPAGCAVCITTSGTTRHQFWMLPTADVIRYRDERRYDEQLQGLFREAVAGRLQHHAPVVAELSGGLDSSSVVCMANHLIRDGAVASTGLSTVSYVHGDSFDVPFIRAVETACDLTGVHVSTDDHPLISARETGGALPEGWAPLHRSVRAIVERLGATVLLTGQNGDLMMGNWFDDSLQVAASLRRGHVRQAGREALAWSRVLRVPALLILWRAMLAALPSSVAPSRIYAIEGLLLPSDGETSLASGLRRRLALCPPQRMFSTDWMQAPPERRKHFQALSVMRELGMLRRPVAFQDLDYTHPFAHRPLVEFLMRVPSDVLCRPGEPRRLMRRALANLWPPAVRQRRSKSLFGRPWFDALRPLAQALSKTRPWQVVERGWVDQASLTSRLERLAHGLACNEPQLRQIILFECWLRNREAHKTTEPSRKTA